MYGRRLLVVGISYNVISHVFVAGNCFVNANCYHPPYHVLVAMLVRWMRRHQSGRRTVAMEDEHVAGEVAVMRSKLQQKDIELREVSEK